MTTTDEGRLKALRLIREDVDADAKALDGQPFDGRTVARNLGQVYASIHALAGILQTVIEELERVSHG